MGADPGVTGAVAFYHRATHRVSAEPLPTHEVKAGRKTRNELAVAELTRLIADVAPVHAYIELVSARPGQGTVSMFRFGYAAGVLHGIVVSLMIPVTFVTPQTWQRDMRVPKGEDGARKRAAQLFPRQATLFSRVKDGHVADAALIAAWGSQQNHV
jgi:crossover junction endodeoxyribonuclease RuvC